MRRARRRRGCRRCSRRWRGSSAAWSRCGARSIAPASCVATRLPVPVVVVGNITVGGSGQDAARHRARRALAARGCRPGIVSRGYGGARATPRAARPERPIRATWATSRCCSPGTGVPVCVGRDRVAAARALLAAHPDVRRDRRRRRPAALRARRATSRSRWSTRRAASATAGCCRPDRCASRRRGSMRSTRSCGGLSPIRRRRVHGHRA